MGYLVLFVGTPYVDGVYADKDYAEEIKKNFMENRFPKLEFEVIEAPKGFRVTDDIFWSRNFDRITRINEGLMDK